MNKTLLNYLLRSKCLIKPIRIFQLLAIAAICTLSTSLHASTLDNTSTNEITTSLDEAVYFAAWQQGANGNTGTTTGGEEEPIGANGGANGGGGNGKGGNGKGGKDCNQVCNTTPQCDGKGNYTVEFLNPNCRCQIRALTPPTCPAGKVYDSATCGCIAVVANGGGTGGATGGANGGSGNVKDCNQVCNTSPQCDGKGNYTIEFLNANCRCQKKPVAPPTCNTAIVCDGQGKITKQQYDPATCGCVAVAVAPPVCPTGKIYNPATCGCIATVSSCAVTCDTRVVCDGQGNLTKQILDAANCKCATVVVSKPTCASGKVYSAATCGCVVATPVCTVTCNATVVCDGLGNLTKQVLNPTLCKCETVNVSKPACGYGKVYSAATCGCVVATPVCTKTCNGTVVCDGRGNLTKQVLNPTTCNCETVKVSSSTQCGYGKVYSAATCGCVVATPVCTKTCNGTVVCDGRGNLTKQVLNPTTCNCETVKVSSTTQCGYGQVYSSATCGCVTAPPVCTKACNGTVVCDGKGNLTKQVLNPTTCNCETVKVSSSTQCGYGKVYSAATCGCVVAPPVCTKTCNGTVVCDGRGSLTKQVLNPTTCNCETVKVSSTTQCGPGKVYSSATCGCVAAPPVCTKTCNGTVVCDGRGNLTKQVLNKATCNCETVSVAKPVCGQGQTYSAGSCGCAATAVISCDKIAITGSTGSITVSNLTAPMKTVKIFDANWQVVYSCTGGDCKATEVISNLHGTYYVNIGFYTQEWHFVCGVKKYVTVTDGKKNICDEFTATEVNGKIVLSAPAGKYTYSIMLIDEWGEQVCKEISIAAPQSGGVTSGGGVTTCTTIFYRDADKDGFGDPSKTITGCAAPIGYVSNADDCNDTTAALPAKPGTACSDGNGKTINDKIQADGCTCAGVVDTAPPANLCDGVSITHGAGKMTITGRAGGTYFYKIDRIKPSFKAIKNCRVACGSSTIMTSLIPGTYEVRVFGADWSTCKDETIVMGGYSGIDSEDADASSRAAINSNTTIDQQHSFYPNPVTNSLFLNLEEYAGQQGTIKLVDQFGQVVQQKSYDAIPTDEIKMDVQRIEDGLHFLNITVNDEKVITEKVMINKF